MEDRCQSREHGVSLLLHCRQITANAAKRADPRRTAKGTSNLLLHFGPAQIPLRLVVGKRDREVVEQGQHLLGTREQRIQEILGRALLDPAEEATGGGRDARIAAHPQAGGGCRFGRPGLLHHSGRYLALHSWRGQHGSSARRADRRYRSACDCSGTGASSHEGASED